LDSSSLILPERHAALPGGKALGDLLDIIAMATTMVETTTSGIKPLLLSAAVATVVSVTPSPDPHRRTAVHNYWGDSCATRSVLLWAQRQGGTVGK